MLPTSQDSKAAPGHIDQETASTEPATAAKSLQSCPTLCNPIDSRPPASPVPGILQASTLKWVATSFSTEPSDHVRLSSSQRAASKEKGTRDQHIHTNLALCLEAKEFSPFSCEWKYFFHEQSSTPVAIISFSLYFHGHTL